MYTVGFPDFRRQVDYDTDPNLSTIIGVSTPSGTQLGPYNVASWSHIAGNLAIVGVQTQVAFTFWSNLALTEFVDSRAIWLDQATGAGNARFRIPVGARWLTVTITTAGGVNVTYTQTLLGSNRGNLPMIHSYTDLVVPYATTGVVAGLSAVVPALVLASGHATAVCRTATQPGVFTLEALTGFGVYSRFFDVPLAANTSNTFPLILPATAWQARIFNAGGVNDGFTFAVTASSSNN